MCTHAILSKTGIKKRKSHNVSDVPTWSQHQPEACPGLACYGIFTRWLADIMGSKNWSYTSSYNDGILPKGPYPPYLCMPFWQDTLEMACHLMTPSHCLNWSWLIFEVWRHSPDRECSRYQSLKCVRILQQHLIGVNELKNHRSWLYSLFLIIIELLCGKIQLFQRYQ